MKIVTVLFLCLLSGCASSAAVSPCPQKETMAETAPAETHFTPAQILGDDPTPDDYKRWQAQLDDAVQKVVDTHTLVSDIPNDVQATHLKAVRQIRTYDYVDNKFVHMTNGTGVAIDASGTVLTAAHVAKDRLLFQWIGATPEYLDYPHSSVTMDISVFKRKPDHDKSTPWDFIPLAKEDAKVGDTIVLVGFPGHEEVTARVVVKATVNDCYPYEYGRLNNGQLVPGALNAIMAIGAISSAMTNNLAEVKGASGGALINEQGELVGILFAGSYPQVEKGVYGNLPHFYFPSCSSNLKGQQLAFVNVSGIRKFLKEQK